MKKTHNAKWIAVSLAGALAGAATISWAAATKPVELPRYVTLDTIKKLRQQKGEPSPVLQPFAYGQTITQSKEGLLNPVAPGAKNGTRIAQVPPPANAKAAPKPAAKAKPKPKTTIPQWVRYPLEFQLCGIGLGSRAVDKDSHNRIDRYGLFAIHGNPTAVVVPTNSGNVSVNQQPLEVAALFPGSDNGHLPAWAAAVTVQLDSNHVEWLYRRETYSMGFIVDRLGFVDAIVLAGTYSPIGKTQLEDPTHSVKLGDDLRKVLYRYGYPDSIDTYTVNVAAGASTGGTGGAAGANPEAMPGAPLPPGGPLGGPQYQGNPQMLPPAPGVGDPGAAGAPDDMGAAGGGGTANSAFRTFELRYEQSYNIVFSIRNNRVVRIYIFGDPDFFNKDTREKLRTKY